MCEEKMGDEESAADRHHQFDEIMMAKTCFTATNTTSLLSTTQTFRNLQPPYMIHIGGGSSDNTNQN